MSDEITGAHVNIQLAPRLATETNQDSESLSNKGSTCIDRRFDGMKMMSANCTSLNFKTVSSALFRQSTVGGHAL